MPAARDDVPAPGSVLILGGTAEARTLAASATTARLPMLSSLAGRVSNPALPVGLLRIGGFGGIAGLATYLDKHQVRAVVDATHPFAATISASAIAACRSLDVPLLRLARPGWSGRPDATGWQWVDSVSAACLRAMELGERPFVTTGRQTLNSYEPMTGRFALVRVVEPPARPLSPAWELITDRGPYRLESERHLMSTYRIDALVTKDSGGSYTAAKLDAAAELGLPVVIVRRPPSDDVTIVDNVHAAISWLLELSAAPGPGRGDHRGQHRG